jgi:hypothetical protein
MAEVQAIAFLGTQRSRILPTDSHSRLVGRSARYLVKSYVMNRLYFGDKWLSDRKEFPDASVKRRLKDAFGEEIEFEEKGQPTDFESAKRLAELDKFQFQHWALLIGARPLKEGGRERRRPRRRWSALLLRNGAKRHSRPSDGRTVATK